jgi:hypothetical protein
MIELPTGELEIYFANEGPYTDSDEQEISKMVSCDKGVSWSSTICYCFPSGGMPVPIIAPDDTMYTAVEDDSDGGAIHLSLIKSEPTPGSTAITKYHSVIPAYRDLTIYAGAPYLAVLGDRILLSGQTSWDRTTSDVSVPFLAINQEGTYSAYNVIDVNPFDIPETFSGLWNSVTTLSDGSILLFTSYNNKIYMLKGKLVETTDCD